MEKGKIESLKAKKKNLLSDVDIETIMENATKIIDSTFEDSQNDNLHGYTDTKVTT